MIYLLIKALHIASVITFVAGVLILAMSVSVDNLVVLRAARRWDLHVTTPALMLVWITGPAIAVMGHAFGAVWLSVKLVLVVGLSVLHGLLAGSLRRAEQQGAALLSPTLRFAAPTTLTLTFVIVGLAVLKPA
ncbi:CopD family protein [Pandoraea communis]|uniref:CopD family protein n=1 Tax=Pandoraea communis TaxID=2508297 RepID=UPI0025A51A45|nr:CopD family protein [Pandoraea communis]MDM8355883.1 CopD family protein [Pandoraea communis]